MRRLILALLLVGCTPVLSPQEATERCVEICKAQNIALDSQCLGELDPSWVCDVAHNPRMTQDNLPENQCASYRDGSHTHFVEVTPQCTVIRVQ